MGLIYSFAGESALALESTSRAYQLRDRASDREKFFIMLMYHRQVTGNLEKAQQICALWAQTYPRDADAHGLWSGFSTQGSGKYEKTIEEANISIGLDPDLPFPYISIAFANFFLDRFGDAEIAAQRASDHKINRVELAILRYYLALFRGDKVAMDRQLALAKGKPGVEDLMLHVEALALARSGQLRIARATSRRAVDLAQQAGQPETAATYQTAEAIWETFFGNAAESRRIAMTALALSKGRDVEYAAAFALAQAGDPSRAQTLASDLDRRFPEDTAVQFNYLPTLRAALALEEGKPSDAIDVLQRALPNELAVPPIAFNSYFGSLYSAYVRGQAYLALHQEGKAATEFQKILTHRGLVGADPVGAMARLQLGRAFAMAGDTAKAKAAYQDFLRLWKDADPGVPILAEAKKEFARL